ncbi:asparaginase [Cohnella pontilimi]|uniref:Asparaginase n=1 Tax=Cohnella pontilimi TaxID=2564100 RepID=A0A4U0FBC2_9BACL|nr:asparaginase [Cohnella pontilimi]TJY42126.1 asparaginase [Cohnella pontilimi]
MGSIQQHVQARHDGNPSMPADLDLVVTTRAGVPENVHRGRISVVSADGGVAVASYGDVTALTFVRSTAKPIQAIAPLMAGTAEAFGWDDRHLALMAASQRGYADQVAALQEMLDRAGIPEEAFVFRAGKPVSSEAREAWAAAGGEPRKLYHTCAGKHLGMLAWSKLEGWPLEGYAEPEHPAQREIARRVREWAGATEHDFELGRDGCGLPVAAMPLERIALSYARLACPDAAADERAAEAASRVAAAMNRHPELVEGPGRLASMLLADPNVVAKSGAQGLFTIGLRRERLGIAIHVADGTEGAWPHVVIALLERLGGVSADTLAGLRARFPAEYRNDAGDIAGRWEIVF